MVLGRIQGQAQRETSATYERWALTQNATVCICLKCCQWCAQLHACTRAPQLFRDTHSLPVRGHWVTNTRSNGANP